MAKAAFNKKKALFASQPDSDLRKKLVKCYIWSIVLHGVGTWTLRKVDQIYLESLEIWCRRRTEKIKWQDRVKNKEAVQKSKEERNIVCVCVCVRVRARACVYNKKEGRLTGLVTSCVGTAF
jgi:hypothetical protein